MGTIGSSRHARAALACAASGAALLCGSATYAETANSAPAVRVEEIVVTAEKRETKLQKTPVAITAFSAARIENQHITSPEQLQFNVPSMVYGQQSGYSFITLRGIGTDATDTSAEPSVATYQDGVYNGSLYTQGVSDFDLARIEVLRGPQSTLYGRNTTGGVVNFITKAPSFQPETNLELGVGNYSQFVGDAGMTGPLVADKIAFRISVHGEEHDGYRPDLNLGTKQDDLHQWGGRGALLFTPDSNLSITLRGDYSHQQTSDPYVYLSSHDLGDPLISPALPLGVFSEPASYFATNPGLLSPADIARLNGGSIANYEGFTSQPGPLPPNPLNTTNVSTGVPTRFVVNSAGTSLTLDWNINGVKLKSITAYRYAHINAVFDSGGYATPDVVFDPLSQSSSQWTQEFNVSGSAFASKLDWLAGVFYLHDTTKFYASLYLPTFGEALLGDIFLANPPGSPYAFNLSHAIPAFFQTPNILATPVISGPNFGGAGTVNADDISTIPTTAFLGFRAIQNSQSIAGFMQGTYHLTDRLRVTAGVRYTDDDKDTVRSVHSNLLVALGALGTLCQNEEARKSWDAVTGTAGLDYDLAQQTMIYAKYSRGYRAGGFSGNDCAGPFNPEYLNSYETGVKSIFGRGQVSVSAAAFYYDYTNIQFTTFVQDATVRTNAGAAELYGAEIEFQAVPAAIPGLSIDGSGSWIHSEYTKGNPFAADGLFPDPSGLYRLNIVGNELIRSPKFKGSLGVQYALPLASTGTVTLRGEAAWTDTIYNDVFNGKAPFQADMTQPPYWLLNARLTWASLNGRFRVQAFCENLTNSLYANNRISFNAPPTVLQVSAQFEAPRTYGLRFAMKY